MTDLVRSETGGEPSSANWLDWRDPLVRLRNVDRLAMLIAVMLPWTTTGTGIAVVMWLIAVVPTVEPRALMRSLQRPASALPIALLALVVVGLLWSDAPTLDRM